MSNRDRGARYENECRDEIYDELGIQLRRELRQYQEADFGDLVSDDPTWPFIIECKRRRTGSYSPAWMVQAVNAANKSAKLPAVFYRFDRQQSWVAVPTYVVAVCFGWSAEEWDDLQEPLHMSVRTFCALAREVWSRSASSEVVCPACLGEGVVTETISDFTGFADDIEADVVCRNCKGEGSWS
jgi:hypothetical protein